MLIDIETANRCMHFPEATHTCFQQYTSSSASLCGE